MSGRSHMGAWAAVAAVLLAAMPVAGQPAAEQAAADGGRAVVLDTTGFWRMCNVLAAPVLAMDGGPKPILYGEPWLDGRTAPPPAGWTKPDFDDSGWVRAVALRACKTPYLARLCLRGKFQVTDPAKIKALTMTVGYHGGVVVTVNGTEIARGHMPAGPVSASTLAEGYPAEAFLMPDGTVIDRRSQGPEKTRRIALRERTLADVPVPAKLLRKGVNVVAVEIIRAPYHKIMDAKQARSRGGGTQHLLTWYTCEVRRVQLSAAGPEGLVANATRPQDWQVWNSPLLMSDFDMDFGDAAEPLRPVRIVAALGGTFNGKVVVGSTRPIRGLKATAEDLKGTGGTIPASAVRIRYAVPWGNEWMTIPYTGQIAPYPRPADVFGALLEEPLDEFPVREKEPAPSRYIVQTPNQPDPVAGAVVPVWMTVTVPADAKPGTYTGRVRIEARDEKAVSVPLEVRVADWALPDAQDYRTWVELVQSPDTLAVHYEMELWSDRHWKMIDRTMATMGEVGSRVLHIPLLAQTNLGNEQSMVRWVRKADGGWDYDFSVMDRYLDSAQKHMGRPKIIAFWVWDIYLIEKEKYQGKDHLILEQAIAARDAMRGTGPMVTVVDPAAEGKLETVSLPPYRDPSSEALWRPLMEKIVARLKARGLEETLMLGVMNDTRPTKQEVEFFNALLPGAAWVSQAHGGFRQNTLLHGIAPIGYQARVWGVAFSATESLHGWNRPFLMAYYDRDRSLTPKTPALWAHLAEMTITGDQRGIGRLGADFWPVYKDRRGRLGAYVWIRYPHSSWRNLDLWSYCLAPGPDGPVAGPHFEYLREGVEHCEARIIIEEALLDPQMREKLGEDLAARCQAALDERQAAMVKAMAHHQMDDPNNRRPTSWRSSCEIAGHMWFVGSGWQDRSARLFDLAGEVTKKLAGQ